MTQPDGPDAEPIPLSALQHAVYCLRQAALIHLERLWQENRYTAEGRVMHMNADMPGSRSGRGVRRETALALASKKLGIAGVADLVEFTKTGNGEASFPVEFKRGKPKLHRADEVQLCAQALCLEEMTGQPVPEGALFYGETKRRVNVTFDDDLRRQTEDAIAALRDIFTSRQTPKAVYKAARCRACSLLELCQPKAMAGSARLWRERRLGSLLASGQAHEETA